MIKNDIKPQRSLQNSLRKRMCVSQCLSPRNVQAPTVVALLIIFIGMAIAAIVLGLDIPNQKQAQNERFDKVADEAFLKFESALEDYKVSGLWLHQACYNKEMSFEDFRNVYEHITSTGLEFQTLSCGLNVSSSEREAYENMSRTYLNDNYPDARYGGFIGCGPSSPAGECLFGPAANASYYFVTHFAEPLEAEYNIQRIDFDVSTAQYRTKDFLELAMETGVLSVTERLRFLPVVATNETAQESYQYSIMFAHPGMSDAMIIDTTASRLQPHLAILVIRFAALLLKAYQDFAVDEKTFVYVYDSTAQGDVANGEPAFLGGAQLGSSELILTPEISLKDLKMNGTNHFSDIVLTIASRQWRLVVLAQEGAYEPEFFLVTFGAIMIVIASVCGALWIHSRSKARAEKSAILLDSAEKAATAERELNDFIAHEVRNPLSAAISANAFVALAVNESKPLLTIESRESVREDVVVIGNSLQYINDLLRSMLDTHRVQSNQIIIQKKHVDIRNDVFAPVASMLYRRGCAFEIILDCPEELVITSDPLRLKQVVLNLTLNSAKFVVSGFVRMGAYIQDGIVCLHVDDSGPGLPVEKRHHLFAKFQQSLDTLHQGTGIGLSLCKQLVELMGGEISLDESYKSGVENCPGARFVVKLNVSPLEWEPNHECNDVSTGTNGETSVRSTATGNELSGPSPPTELQADHKEDGYCLPESISVLFVDDDFILRKLFARSLKRCRPKWTICEAASGEAALQLVDERGQEGMFDVIFMDQYMASTQKQLLGTETVSLLRSKGIEAIVCGLSANNLGQQFIDAGADYFLLKPLPCETGELAATLQRIMESRVDLTGRHLATAV